MSAMEQQRRITPPPELMEQWQDESPETQIADHIQYLAIRAAQWGWDQREPEIQAAADQELEACCEWLEDPHLNVDTYKLRAARRAAAPSLKEEALGAAIRLSKKYPSYEGADIETILRALEALL